MADNLSVSSGSATYTAATDKVTYSGDANVDVQLVHPVGVTGAEGSKTAVEFIGSAGTAAAGAITVQGIASMTPVQVGDNSGSLTVDAPVGTPVFVRLSDGASAISALPVTDNSGSLTVDNAGTFAVQNTPVRAATATITTQADQATSATLVASNANRRAVIIFNDSTVVLYVKYGATASATDWTYRLQAGEDLREEMYTGRIDGIWASDASGSARVTELT